MWGWIFCNRCNQLHLEQRTGFSFALHRHVGHNSIIYQIRLISYQQSQQIGNEACLLERLINKQNRKVTKHLISVRRVRCFAQSVLKNLL